MAKRKKTKRDSDSGGLLAWFTEEKPKRRSKPQPVNWKRRLLVFAVIFGWIAVGAGLAVGFYYMKQYIAKNGPTAGQTGPWVLIDPPAWLSQDWIAEIERTVGGVEFPLEASSARNICERLETLSWMVDIKIRTTPERHEVRARYRRPAARVRLGGERWVYLDEELFVLDYLPLSAFPVVEVRGLSTRSMPGPGSEFHSDSAKAAVELLKYMEQMDQKVSPEKPLLGEIEYLDVSNYGGRRSASRPHLVLKALDGTEIQWGAACGQSARYLEAGDVEKLTKLYNFYRQNGNTLLGKVKYVDLFTPLTQRPRPR